jgi:hypothetical protein
MIDCLTQIRIETIAQKQKWSEGWQRLKLRSSCEIRQQTGSTGSASDLGRSRSPVRRTEDARQDGSGPSGSSVTYNVTATELVELVRHLATNNTSANVPGPQKAGPLAAVHEALAELRAGKAEDRGTR